MATERTHESRTTHDAQRCGLTPPPAWCPFDDARARQMPELASRHMRDPRSRGLAPPPPGPMGALGFGCGGFVSGGDVGQEAQERTEVKVKNTFIHVEDVARTVQRSLSESDLSSSGSATFWSHNDTSSPTNSSSGHSVPDLPSAQARSNAKPTGSKVDDARGAKIANHFAQAGFPPPITVRSMQKTFDPAPGGSSSAEAASVQGAQSYAPIAASQHTEGKYDSPDIVSEEEGEDLGDVPDEGGTANIQWSVGSEQHAAGNCRPCMYFRQSSGCFNGRNCVFCHVPHKTRSRVRPCKAKRLKCKQMLEMYDTLRAENSPMADVLRREMDAEFGSSPPEMAYMMKVIAGKAEAQEKYRGRSGQSAGSSTTLQQHVRHQSDLPWKMRL